MARNLLNRGMIQFIRLNYGKLSLTVDNKQLHGCPEEEDTKRKKEKDISFVVASHLPILVIHT